MKFPISNFQFPISASRRPRRDRAAAGGQLAIGNWQLKIGNAAAFTMIEIALCLAIIGFALVSILLVLPSGMNTQRETREETIISQDASMLLEAIRNGSRGLDDLTNNVYAITNYITFYDAQGLFLRSTYAGYTYTTAVYDGAIHDEWAITNGLRIIGLLSTPEFLAGNQPLYSTFGNAYTSNHIIAYIHSFSGLAAEKPPQNNQIMQEDAFSYRLLCVNAPMAMDTNNLFKPSPNFSAFDNQLAGSLRELRLLFMWPQLPNGNVGPFRQSFRVSIAGQLIETNYADYFPNIQPLYFYESQSFTNTP
jgi:type II secretory pathway pseudopilin PulG